MNETPTKSPSEKPDPMTQAKRSPEVNDALRHTRQIVASAQRRRERTPRLRAEDVDIIIDYLFHVEQVTISEMEKRKNFEAEAEGEFASLRLHRRAWKEYSIYLDGVVHVMQETVARLLVLVAPPKPRWWHLPTRRKIVANLREVFDDLRRDRDYRLKDIELPGAEPDDAEE